MEGKRPMIVTTSWDDGSVEDVRLADLMRKYGIRGTFYVPQMNSDGRATMSVAELRDVARDFEIGAHSLNHVRLHNLPADVARNEITGGKRYLEDALGHGVAGFCYPGGNFTPRVTAAVIGAGFAYARTTVNLCCGTFADPFLMPTTVQFFPRFGLKYAKSYLAHGHYAARLPCFLAALQGRNLEELIERIVARARASGCYLHIWGHSWEIDRCGLWPEVEGLFRRLREIFAEGEFFSNHGAVQAVERVRAAARAAAWTVKRQRAGS